uniref:Apoptotic chromatin condensation inducer 1b n=1 Tax=Neogobius melanostomus TaxID=47308 RepID=A0A8C6UDX1_9GOBI
MADDDITLDGKPLQSLRVADLKAALEQRNLPKTGQKNALLKRLKGALMLENLQKSSSSHGGIQPNSQIGEEMSQNSFIQQYLAKQQELLRQRLEKEAQQEEKDEECGTMEEKDHLLDSFVKEQSSLARSEEKVVESFGHGLMAFGSTLRSEDGVHGRNDVASQDPQGSMFQHTSFYQGQQELPAPSPPRAVASLSVRVLGQPECQGLPPALPRMQEKANAAPSESSPPVLHLSRSAGVSLAAREDSDTRDSSDDDSDDDDWGPTASRRGSKVAPQPQPPSVATASGRSKRKLQPPQHIPPPQLHSPLQLRHPTPPPSPPPNLFPLPDTPKQSPPDADQNTGEGSKGASFPPETMQRQDSDSSSRSSSPEPPAKRRPGPLSLLVHKMESEQALDEAQSTSTANMPGEETQTLAGSVSKRMGEKEKVMKTAEKEGKDFEEDKNGKLKERRDKPWAEKINKEKDIRQGLEMAKGHETPDHMKMPHSSAMVTTEAQDFDSSSDSDSSSRSSSEMKKKTISEKADQGQKKDGFGHFRSVIEKDKRLQKREVSEPSAAAVTEEEPDSESSMALPAASGAEPENSEVPVEESTTPKAFAARKISLTSNKMSPGSAERGVSETEAANAGRKRRWGSSTAVTAKKPSISITTDSLKSLIPDIKVNQEAVVDLPAEELQYSGDEDTMDSTQDEQDNGLKIQRTVTQVVSSNTQKNGGNEEEDGEKTDREKPHKVSRDRRKSSVSEEVTEPTTSPKVEEATKVSPCDSLVRRSISQQKSGVSVTIDDPIRSNRQPSPPRGKVSNIIHVTNLVRPFTLGQLKELLNQTGSVVEDGFWIDKIKSHCYVTYSTTEEAVTTRNTLHGVKWPQSNPKVLSVDFCEQDELDFHKGILKIQKEPEHGPPVPGPPSRPPPLMPERDRDRDRDKERERDRDRGLGVVRDLWAEREREMERRERARGEREWDRDKIREFARPGEDGRRSRSRERERRRRERARSKERKSDKKEKGDEPPAKLLDDLFMKTKAAPCIYWLPLTEEQAAQRVLARTERKKERERIRKEMAEEDKKREEEKRERLKAREKESVAGVGAGTARRVSEGDRDRERGREGDRRRDGGHRPRRLSAGNPRRSRSRSNPRDRRR